MKTVMREGPSARAASVVGATDPTLSPKAEAAKDSRVRRVRKEEKREKEAWRPAMGYTREAKRRGKRAPTGSSARSLEAK